MGYLKSIISVASLFLYFAAWSPADDALVYSTCLGGSSCDQGWSIEVDARGYACVTTMFGTNPRRYFR